MANETTPVAIDKRVYEAATVWADYVMTPADVIINRVLRHWLADLERTTGNPDGADEWLKDNDDE